LTKNKNKKLRNTSTFSVDRTSGIETAVVYLFRNLSINRKTKKRYEKLCRIPAAAHSCTYTFRIL